MRILRLKFAEHNIVADFDGRFRDVREDEAKMKVYAAVVIGMAHRLDGVRLQPQQSWITYDFFRTFDLSWS
jgi:hypothetical protein